MIDDPRDKHPVRPSEHENGNDADEHSHPTSGEDDELVAQARMLAALMDGRLDSVERAELLARLDASPNDLEVLADAASSLEATSDTHDAAVDPTADPAVDAGHVAQVTPIHAARRRSVVWLVAAACVVGAVLIPYLWMHRGARSTSVDPERFASALPASTELPAAWGHPWTMTRGEQAPLTAAARAVRLGVQLTDLTVVARGSGGVRDSMVASTAAATVALLDDVNGAAPIAALYRDVVTRAHEPPGQLAPLLDSGARAVRRLPAGELVDLGAWTEAARLAAVTHDAEFFQAAMTRDVIDRAARDPSVSDSAHALIEQVRRDTTQPITDWAIRSRRLDDLLGVLAR